MCGICGFIKSSGGGRAELQRMASALEHRGPDDAGYYLDDFPAPGGRPEHCRVGLGHRRLSIIDLSAAGQQPMLNEDGSLALVFNGEIYNFRSIRRELQERGHRFRSKTDSEVLLHGYEEWGLGVLDRLNGMFALGLWDKKNRRLVLARDRVGIKPLYYHSSDGTFLFASELSSLRENPSFKPAVDKDTLSLYLDLSYVPAPRTIYRNTYKLPPGEYLVWENGTVCTKRYWSLDRGEIGASSGMAFEEAKEHCTGLIKDSVSIRLMSDVPLGAFLSGGYDSSLVVAMMKAVGAPRIDTYSLGFTESSYNEAHHARALAQHLETNHHELILTPEETIGMLDRLALIYDEPLGDPSAMPTHLVSKFARDSGTVVALSGDGGDELFCGYDRYASTTRMHEYARIPRPLRRVGSALLKRVPSRRWRRIGAEASLETLSDLYHHRMSTWKEGSPYTLVLPRGVGSAGALPDGFDYAAHAESVFGSTRFNELFGGLSGIAPPAVLSFVDIHTYMVDDILTKVDRASMAVSLEVRVPLLDHRIVEFAVRTPLDFKFRNGRGKYLLKSISRDFFPASMLDRPKRGFGIPANEWMRGPLRGLLEKELEIEKLYTNKFLP